MPAPCPVRLLVKGDRVRLPEGAHADVTGVYPLPGRVEVSWMTDDCFVGSRIFAPDVELLVIRTAAEQVLA